MQQYLGFWPVLGILADLILESPQYFIYYKDIRESLQHSNLQAALGGWGKHPHTFAIYTPSICENDTLYSSFNRDNCRMHPLREFSCGSLQETHLFTSFFYLSPSFYGEKFFLSHLFTLERPLSLVLSK